MTSNYQASSIYHPRMALSRLASDIRSGQNSPAATFGKGLAFFLGAVTVVPVVADALTTQLAKHRGVPLFSSSCCIRDREALELNAAMFASDSKYSTDPRLSNSVELPSLAAHSVMPLIELLVAGLAQTTTTEALTGHLTARRFEQVRAMLRNGTPEAVFLDALISKKSSGLEAFVGKPDWRTKRGASHEIVTAECPSKSAALLTGSTFAHGPDAPLRCQDGVYLGTYSTVVTDGQGGHALHDYDHLRAMQTSVGLMAAETIDQIGKLHRPDSFLRDHHVTLVRLINAAAYAFKPNQEQGESGVAFTAVADFGWRGVYAFGVGDCTAAVRYPSKVKGGESQFTEFTPERRAPDTERAHVHAVGIQPFNDQVVQFQSLGAKADQIYVMSDGVQGFVMKDAAAGSSAAIRDGKSRELSDTSGFISWADFEGLNSQGATKRVASALSKKADTMGWNYTQLLLSDFIKDSREKDDAFNRLMALRIPEGDEKSLPTTGQVAQASGKSKSVDRAAALLFLRLKGAAALDSDAAAEKIKLKPELNFSTKQWSDLMQLAQRNLWNAPSNGEVSSALFETGVPASGEKILGEAVNYVGSLRLAGQARATMQRVISEVGLGSEAESTVWAELAAERASYINGKPPEYLAGRDDATFVSRDRQPS